MPQVGDFTVIQKGGSGWIGDLGSKPRWEKEFTTSGREAGGYAILMCMVHGLTQTKTNAEVYINEKKIGEIKDSYGAPESHLYTQIIPFSGSILNNGLNKIAVYPATWAGAKAGNLYDDFMIQDVIVFFKQDA